MPQSGANCELGHSKTSYVSPFRQFFVNSPFLSLLYPTNQKILIDLPVFLQIVQFFKKDRAASVVLSHSS